VVVLQALSSRTISCSGTVCARAIGILDFLAQKLLLILSLLKAVRWTWGVDQGLCNYMLYIGVTRAAISKPNFARVARLTFVKGSTLSCDATGRVINRDAEISEIAHQWDRHRHLTKRICAVYLGNRPYGRWRSWMARVLPVLAVSTWSHLL
jgi:hypothetical protein